MAIRLTYIATWLMCCLVWQVTKAPAAEPDSDPVKSAALQMLASPEQSVRVAALRVLGQVGTSADVPLLLQKAGKAETPAEKQAAFEALTALKGEQVNAVLLAAMEDAPAAGRALIIRVLTERRAVDATPQLLGRAEDPDPQVRQECWKALQVLAEAKHAPVLIQLLMKVSSDEERELAERAVYAACQKAADAQQVCTPILQALDKATAAQRRALLPVLGRLGGPQALEQIEAALADADPQVRRAAVRGLCNWPDATVADRLLAIARQPETEEYRIWAVRAIARVAPLPDARPPQTKFDLLNEAMQLAQRTEDKRLILTRLAAVRVPEAVELALAHCDDPQLAAAAQNTLVALCEAMAANHPQLCRQAIERILPTLKDVSLKQRAQRVLQRAGGSGDGLRK